MTRRRLRLPYGEWTPAPFRLAAAGFFLQFWGGQKDGRRCSVYESRRAFGFQSRSSVFCNRCKRVRLANGGSQDGARTASLQQRAAVLRLYAIQLHTAAPAVPLHRSATTALLAALFGLPAGEGACERPARDVCL